MNKKIVVVMGGTSTEAEVSRRTGSAIYSALKKKGYNVVSMELNPPTFADDIQREKPDIVFNALHGKFGEDGLLQGTLDMLNIPYTGSGVLAAALTMDKGMTKRVLKAENVRTPNGKVYYRFQQVEEVEEDIRKEFSLPCVIKATDQGSSIGVYIVDKAEDIKKAVEECFRLSATILAEEFIDGRELTVALWGNSETVEAFPIIEITTLSGKYDYESKYTVGASSHIIPAKIPPEVAEEVAELAKKTFHITYCAGVARVDFMLSKDNKPYVIEVNSVPGMTETSLVPDAARAMGMEFGELCEKILIMAGFEKD
ncbi:MAG: D-alanine--D-alanine ligase [Selenomonadaceae bacterium]|nr:D-alanine--D-alanine ligase [Selenomonadaceae bacterium]